jgi:hypothetical protein
MSSKVVYVPLDERNCNYSYPYELGSSSGMEIVRPPEEIMSSIKRPCDIEAMWEWLFKNIQDCEYVVLSLDMLIYGSILCSRHHNMTQEESIMLLNRLRKLKEINPKVEIHAFILIMRVANYDNCSEEPDYWESYGRKIWKYSWLTGKGSKGGLDDAEGRELEELKAAIPGEILKDYMDRRKINLQVNLNTLDLVEENIIDHLVIPKDDTSEYGFSTDDQGVIYSKVCEKHLQDRVFIYPGTDEVGCTLVARVFNKINGIEPRVYVYYSSTLGPGIIAAYEDRPINESIKWQIISAGGMLAESYNEADFILMANTPGKYMMESAQQLKRDPANTNFRNLTEFVQKIRYYTNCGKICVVADIAYSNGADNELMEMMMRGRLLDKIAGYGGWNTAANTLGVVILQGAAASALKLKKLCDNYNLFRFHVKKIIEDWAYQANVQRYFVDRRSKEMGFDCYRLGSFKDIVADEITARLNAFIKLNLEGKLPVSGLNIKGIKLTWERVFDMEPDLDMKL